MDEFQQLFLDATGRQTAVIDDCLKAITRKGRATGVHLIFASQQMQGTGIDLANFKIRFALSCDKDISQSIIGNSAAASLKIGEVYLNMKSGNAEDNILYQVPLAEDTKEDPYFTNLRQEIYEEARFFEYSYIDEQKFYREDQQKKLTQLEEFLNGEKIFSHRSELVSMKNRMYYLPLVLGRTVVYNHDVNDIENILIESGKNHCILVVSPDFRDLAYMQKLIAVNFKNCKIEMAAEEQEPNLEDISCYYHFYLSLSPIVRSMYQIEDDLPELKGEPKPVRNRIEELDEMYNSYYMRKKAIDLLRLNLSLEQFCIEMEKYRFQLESELAYKALLSDSGLLDEAIEMLKRYVKTENDIPRKCKVMDQCRKIKVDNPHFSPILSYMNWYYRYKVQHMQENRIFSPIVVWISGSDMIERKDRRLLDMASNGMDVNMMVIFFSSSKESSDVNNVSNYIFVGGKNRDLYESYLAGTSANSSNDIVMECRIKNISKTIAFKKYRVELVDNYKNSINFDNLLGV